MQNCLRSSKHWAIAVRRNRRVRVMFNMYEKSMPKVRQQNCRVLCVFAVRFCIALAWRKACEQHPIREVREQINCVRGRVFYY